MIPHDARYMVLGSYDAHSDYLQKKNNIQKDNINSPIMAINQTFSLIGTIFLSEIVDTSL